MTLILDYTDDSLLAADAQILNNSEFWAGLDMPCIDVDFGLGQILVYLTGSEIKSVSELSIIFNNGSELIFVANDWILMYGED